MHRNASGRAPAVVQAVGIGGARRMLDIGGGSGAYSIAFAKAEQNLNVEIFDLPTVVPIAAKHVADENLSDRITTRVGDLRVDEFGTGYDLILLFAVCHMLGVDANKDLLKRCARALAPNGRIVIQDFILQPSRTAPQSAALFALNMLVGTSEGSSYTDEEYRKWLTQAGLADVQHVKLPGPAGLMIGRHP
jgi:cyclopropane fatty-acyl-phospholipid synthase-like methyltransferase